MLKSLPAAAAATGAGAAAAGGIELGLPEALPFPFGTLADPGQPCFVPPVVAAARHHQKLVRRPSCAKAADVVVPLLS